MNKISALFLSALVLTGSARATTSTNVGALIPDGDLDGYQSSQSLANVPGAISHVSVTLNLLGGFNGDIYAFISHNNSQAVLLNRAGRTSSSASGYSDAGFGTDASLNSFTFDDLASHDVHLYRTFSYSLNGSGQLTGGWQPDGRTLDPLSPGSAFDVATRANTLHVFNGMDPNGVWTLFISDVSPLGESTLISWGLDITTVPEPSVGTLLCCLLGGLLCLRKWAPGQQ
jgi:subtilisin-like proprotein convertase family protein